MDIMTLTTKFLTGLVSKIITKQVKKQIGQDCEIHVNEIRLKSGSNDGMLSLHLDVDCSMSALNLQAALKKADIL